MEQKLTTRNPEKEKLLVEKHLNKEKVKWGKWKAECYSNGIKDISKKNSDLIMQYLKDMEMGLNVSSVTSKGARSPILLNDLRGKMIVFSKKFEELYGITDLDVEGKKSD